MLEIGQSNFEFDITFFESLDFHVLLLDLALKLINAGKDAISRLGDHDSNTTEDGIAPPDDMDDIDAPLSLKIRSLREAPWSCNRNSCRLVRPVAVARISICELFKSLRSSLNGIYLLLQDLGNLDSKPNNTNNTSNGRDRVHELKHSPRKVILDSKTANESRLKKPGPEEKPEPWKHF